MAAVPVGILGVLFDMDGVLALNGAFHAQAWRRIFRKHFGLDVALDDARFHGGKSRFIIQAVTGQLLPQDRAWAIHLEKEELYRQLASGKIEPTPGLSIYLERLQKYGVPLGLVTSADEENVDFVLGALGLSNVFASRVLGSDVTTGKPDPTPYLLGASRLELAPEACLVHEDSVAGVRSGATAGCVVHAVLTTCDEPALRAAGARWVTPNFSGWLEVLDRTV